MAHISRKELRKDEFREGLESTYEFLGEHKRAIWQASVVVVVALCAFFGWRYYMNHRNATALAAYAAAIKVYNTPVATNGQPVPGEKTYPTKTAKYEMAAKVLGPVATRYAGTRYGQMARYYAGISEEHLGKYTDAARWLEPLARNGDAQFQALAKFALAHLYDRMGKHQQVVALYQELLKNPNVFVPKPVVLLALADHYQTVKDTTLAVKYYERIKSEYPNTGVADQASQRLEMLGKT